MNKTKPIYKKALVVLAYLVLVLYSIFFFFWFWGVELDSLDNEGGGQHTNEWHLLMVIVSLFVYGGCGVAIHYLSKKKPIDSKKI
jgi:drug/metabolite transporter (DMT)-like permease